MDKAKFGEKSKKITREQCFDQIGTKGRPKLIINELGKEIITNFAAKMCTEEEIAGVLGVSVETLKTEENKETFSECLKKGHEQGKASLRAAQFDCARRGNAIMLIFLGKNYLGQRDTLDVAADSEQLEKLDSILSNMTRKAFGERAEDCGKPPEVGGGGV